MMPWWIVILLCLSSSVAGFAEGFWAGRFPKPTLKRRFDITRSDSTRGEIRRK